MHRFPSIVAIVATFLALAILTSPAAAQDLTSTEKRFLKALTTGLGDESREVRAAAEEALVMMGRRAAVYLVAEIGRLGADAQEGAVQALVRIGQPALEVIDGLAKPPVGRAKKALDLVRADLVGEGGIGGFGTSDAATASRVRKLLAAMPQNSYTPSDPRLDDLAALGRPAIPVLLDRLNPAFRSHLTMEGNVVCEVLSRILTPDDVPRLCRLLDLGWLQVSTVLKKIGDPKCVPALIRAMELGRMSWDLSEAISDLNDPRTRPAVIRFLEEHGRAFPHGTRNLLDLLLSWRASEALPVLREMAAATAPGRSDPNRASNEVALGRALAFLGESTGIPLLIRNLDPGEHDEWCARQAGESLNALTGQVIWTAGGNPRVARDAFTEWWGANHDRLVFNPAMRCYELRR